MVEAKGHHKRPCSPTLKADGSRPRPGPSSASITFEPDLHAGVISLQKQSHWGARTASPTKASTISGSKEVMVFVPTRLSV